MLTIEEIILKNGSHTTPEDGMCAMEAAAYLAGEPHSDHPQCVCPVIAAYMRSWQDVLPDDLRQELVKPLIPLVIGSRSIADVQDRRAVLVADWCQCVVLPIWCDLVPSLAGTAASLRSLPEATTVGQLTEPSRMLVVSAASDAAYAAASAAASDAAYAAAYAAASDAASDAARAAASDAAYAAAYATAYAAARAAASAAARAAARAAASDAASDAAYAAASDASSDAASDAAYAAASDAACAAKARIWRETPAMILRLVRETA